MKSELVKIAVTEDLLASLKTGVKDVEEDMRKTMALKYFREKRLSMGKAARLAGMNRFAFMDFLVQNGQVVFDYDETVADREIESAKELEETS